MDKGTVYRAVARSENLGGHIVLGGDNVPPPLDEIGLTDLPKSGGARAPPPACDGPAIMPVIFYKPLKRFSAKQTMHT